MGTAARAHCARDPRPRRFLEVKGKRIAFNSRRGTASPLASPPAGCEGTHEEGEPPLPQGRWILRPAARRAQPRACDDPGESPGPPRARRPAIAPPTPAEIARARSALRLSPRSRGEQRQDAFASRAAHRDPLEHKSTPTPAGCPSTSPTMPERTTISSMGDVSPRSPRIELNTPARSGHPGGSCGSSRTPTCCRKASRADRRGHLHGPRRVQAAAQARRPHRLPRAGRA